MSINRRLAAGRTGHIDARIVRRIIGNASTNLEHLHIGARAVLQTMPVAIASLKAGGIAAAQEFLAGICHESNFAGQHVDEFVGLGMPMALAGPRAGRQCQQIDAELGQSGSVTKLAALSARHGASNGAG